MKKTSLLTIAFCVAACTTAFSQAPGAIEVHAKRFAFVPSSITVKRGQPVKLELISDDVAHSLRIDPLHVNVRMPAGKSVDLTITPEQTGDFKGRCGVYCGKGHDDMFFTVHVIDGK
jgi:cytochrome c oxidase subunit 2